MDNRTREAERTLRDYPISLRETARAVFGSAYEAAEKRAMEDTDELAPAGEEGVPLSKA
ncbi:MAG: hypothetical protein QM690_17080 [Sphingobium sp.]